MMSSLSSSTSRRTSSKDLGGDLRDDPPQQQRPYHRSTSISSGSGHLDDNQTGGSDVNNNTTGRTSDQRPGFERGSSSAVVGGSLHRPKLTNARSRGKSFINSQHEQDDLVLPTPTITPAAASSGDTTTARLEAAPSQSSKTRTRTWTSPSTPTRSDSQTRLPSLSETNNTGQELDSSLRVNTHRASRIERQSLARRASTTNILSTPGSARRRSDARPSPSGPSTSLTPSTPISTSASAPTSKEAQTLSSPNLTSSPYASRQDRQPPHLSPVQAQASQASGASASVSRGKSRPRAYRSASVKDVPSVSIHLEGVPLDEEMNNNIHASSGGTSSSQTQTSTNQASLEPTRRANRPASKSVSSVLGRPSQVVGIARTTTHHGSGSYTPERRAPSILLDRIGEFDDDRYAHLQQRRPSRDETVESKDNASRTNTAMTTTRSRSTSIAKHPEVVDLHARHTRPYDPTSSESMGGPSSPAPTRMGLTRRISAPNVKSSGSGSGSGSVGKDEILPTLPVGSDDSGSNSLGLSKISPGRPKAFPRFAPSPSLEPRILEESNSQPSSPELELDLDDPAIVSRVPVLSPPPGRTSLSTISSTAEGEGSVSTVDRTASYPITPRGSIPNEDEPDDTSKSGFNVFGGVIQGLGKAVGFNLSNSGRYASIPHHDYAADEDESQQERQTRSWISLGKRRSLEDTDSEKGLNSREPSDDEGTAASAPRTGGARSTRTGGSSSRRPDGGSYFFLEPYASQESSGPSRGTDTLPTPALSRASLSGLQGRPASGRTSSSLFERRRPGAMSNDHGFTASFWRVKDYLAGTSSKGRGEAFVMKHSGGFSSPEAKAERLARGRSDSLLLPKSDGEDATVGMNTAFKQVVGELGWTLGMMGIVFFASFGVVAFGIKSMPITSLHSLPKKVSDLQILSAEIRAYMSSSTTGWWHTVCVLMVTGMWKHSWSIPGALILNILVGSLLSPIPAVILLTVITSFGSLGAYMLSRPLAPLIALIFPKPLAIVRSAIKGNTEPALAIGPYQPIRKPAPAAEGGVWRRLLIMRAMGLVPWSGMNVACGVVGVSWVTFLLTTAAGSASWSYVTASVGDILGQLALPKDPGNGDTDPNAGQSIASLVQDPVLIAKMVVLSLISLIPALFKSRSGTVDTAPPPGIEAELESEYPHPHISQDAQAMTPLAPTASWWQVVNFANLLIRKTTRIAHTGWNAVVGEARDDYSHLQPAQ